MAEPNWERYGAGAGLGTAVLLAIQAFFAPLYPSFEDSPLAVAQYYRENASAIRVQILFTGLAGVLFLWFLGSLRAHLRISEGDTGRISAVAFGSGIAAVGPIAVGVLATATAAHLAGAVAREGWFAYGPLKQIVQVPGLAAVVPLHDMRLLSYALTWFAVAPLLAATAVVSARHGTFPRWYMNTSYALFVLSLGTGLSVLIDTGLFAPGGVYDLILFGLFVVWLGITSWLIMQAYAPPTSAQPATAPATTPAEPTTTQELPEIPPAS
ncbi:MAG TPA: hypothetical protein VGR33_07950 [Actinomycetota bacterium]|jgi:hypothetical protein|nr:hypothetical protein [Actinomycetota bacterium]